MRKCLRAETEGTCQNSSDLLHEWGMRSFDVFFDLSLEQMVKQTDETPVIWDAIVLVMTSL